MNNVKNFDWKKYMTPKLAKETKVVSFRVTKEEYEWIKLNAKEYHISPSMFLQKLITLIHHNEKVKNN